MHHTYGLTPLLHSLTVERRIFRHQGPESAGNGNPATTAAERLGNLRKELPSASIGDLPQDAGGLRPIPSVIDAKTGEKAINVIPAGIDHAQVIRFLDAQGERHATSEGSRYEVTNDPNLKEAVFQCLTPRKNCQVRVRYGGGRLIMTGVLPATTLRPGELLRPMVKAFVPTAVSGIPSIAGTQPKRKPHS